MTLGVGLGDVEGRGDIGERQPTVDAQREHLALAPRQLDDRRARKRLNLCALERMLGRGLDAALGVDGLYQAARPPPRVAQLVLAQVDGDANEPGPKRHLAVLVGGRRQTRQCTPRRLEGLQVGALGELERSVVVARVSSHQLEHEVLVAAHEGSPKACALPSRKSRHSSASVAGRLLINFKGRCSGAADRRHKGTNTSEQMRSSLRQNPSCSRGVATFAPQRALPGTTTRMRAIPLVFLLLACAHLEVPPPREQIVSVQSRLGVDVCAVRLWGDADASRRAENRLLPEAELLDGASPLRLHAGELRDFVLPPMGKLHLEAVGCDGRLVARRDVEAGDAMFTLAAR